ncbi:MAG: hypothetical protein OHK0011_18250 [Turneriella sp.]
MNNRGLIWVLWAILALPLLAAPGKAAQAKAQSAPQQAEPELSSTPERRFYLGLNAYAAPGYGAPALTGEKLLMVGGGAMLQYRLFASAKWRNLQPTLAMEFQRNFATGLAAIAGNAAGGLTYMLPVSARWNLAPFVLGGVQSGKVDQKNTFLLGLGVTGIEARYALSERVNLALGLRQYLYFDPEGVFTATGVGVGLGTAF